MGDQEQAFGMTAYSVVRGRVKAGRQKDFEDRFREMSSVEQGLPGFRKVALLKIGDTSYCSIAEWDSYKDLVNARPAMIGQLDRMRDILEDLPGDLGVTYAFSAEAIFEMAKKA